MPLEDNFLKMEIRKVLNDLPVKRQTKRKLRITFGKLDEQTAIPLLRQLKTIGEELSLIIGIILASKA